MILIRISYSVIDTIFSSSGFSRWAIAITRMSVVCLCPSTIRENRYSSLSSRWILILFVLLDRSMYRAQNLSIFFSNFKFYRVEFQVFNENFKNATPPSILDRFRFCLFCWIDLGTGHKTYRFFFSNFKFHGVEFWVFNENFKNATPPSILDRFWFCLFCLIDL